MSAKPIQGVATVSPTPPLLPPALAEWTVNGEAKNATATILGGVATIDRHATGGHLQAEFILPVPTEEAPEGKIKLSFNLRDCENLKAAQLRTEQLVRESLAKTHPELLTSAASEEQAQTIASAGPDPF